VQGASTPGLIPMMFPDYQKVVEPEVRARFEKHWKLAPGTLDAKPGLTGHRGDARHQRRQGARHVRHGREPGDVRPRRQPRPRGTGAAGTPGGAGHLPDRDRLPGRRGAARQRLPREDRHLHQHRPPGAAGPAGRHPPGDAKQDLWIIQEIASRIGLDWNYKHVSEVFDEMRHSMPSISGITWDRSSASTR
jgi:formate dehydrogenase major subunit